MKKIILQKSNCLPRIQSVYDSLKSAEQRLADYILNNPNQTANMTIEQLAEDSATSYATVNRFCKKLDYSGYKEFRMSLVSYLTSNKDVNEIISSLDINASASIEEICEKTYSLAYKVLDESLTYMDISVVDAVVDEILAARKVCFVGSGTSGICAMYAATKCLSIGIPSQYYADSTFYRMMVSLLDENDVLFAISSSGRTSDVVEAAKLAKKNGVKVISLSDFAISPLAKVSDYSLYTTPRNGSTFLNIDMPLFMGQVTMLDMLYTCLCVKSPKSSTSAYSKTRESVDSEKIK